MEYLSFLYGSVEPYFWDVLSSCARVLHQHSYLLQIRVVQQKQFGSASVLFSDRRSKFSLLMIEELVFLVLKPAVLEDLVVESDSSVV